MFSNQIPHQVYTPEEVAKMLKMSKNTIYDLIKDGQIIAKKYGKLYRIPASSISFIFSGLDYDLYQAEQEDLKSLETVNKTLKQVRSEMSSQS